MVKHHAHLVSSVLMLLGSCSASPRARTFLERPGPYIVRSEHTGEVLEMNLAKSGGKSVALAAADASHRLHWFFTAASEPDSFLMSNGGTDDCLTPCDEQGLCVTLCDAQDEGQYWQVVSLDALRVTLRHAHSGMLLTDIGPLRVSGQEATGAQPAWSLLDGRPPLAPLPRPYDVAHEASSGSTRSIYAVYPSLFSASGHLSAVTKQLPRIKAMGFDTIYLMPLHPMGNEGTDKPSYQSPYCISDFYGLDPKIGDPATLQTLVAEAHGLGLRVIMDMVLNHSAWNSPLLKERPDYYEHENNDATAPIVQAFNYVDVAQFNYHDNGEDLTTYMATMVEYWLRTYHIDGFRFDTVSNPSHAGRKITRAAWEAILKHLRRVKPDVFALAESDDPDMAKLPFDADYNWSRHGALEQATRGGDASRIRGACEKKWASNHLLGLNYVQNWDTSNDLDLYADEAGVRAAAVVSFALDGIPMIFNGEEVGNLVTQLNPHTPINWDGPAQNSRARFFEELLALRNDHPALYDGSTRFLDNSAPQAVLSWMREGGHERFVVVVNFSHQPQDITLAVGSPQSTHYVQVYPKSQPPPSVRSIANLSLAAREFLILQQTSGAL